MFSKTFKKLLNAVSIVVAGTAIVVGTAVAEERSERALASLRYANAIPDEMLVQFRYGVTAAGRASVRARIGAERLEQIVKDGQYSPDGGTLELLRIPPGIGIAAAVRKIADSPEVDFAEPNFIYNHDAVSNDTYYANGSLWGMYGDATTPANQYGSQAGEAWAAGHTNCSSVYVGIIDEGYMFKHADIGDVSGNAGVNPGEIAGNGVDDDGNGYTDDVYGWDFDRNDNSVYDGTQDDHGTHVAGTIGGLGGNGYGVVGVCWKVKLISAKFLGRAGGTTANAIKAVDYITDLKTRHSLNIVATNNSWGGGGSSQALQDAIERANAANILFVAAAGNGGSDGIGDNNDVVANYPSNYPNNNVIAVAAITSSGARASFSNYGATKVDLGAPGSGIYSTLPGKNNSSTYRSYSGTSMATPHVTGAAALYAATYPTTHGGTKPTAAQVKNGILSSTVPTASLSGKTVTGGRLNVSGF